MDEGGSAVGPNANENGLEPWEQFPADEALGRPAESPRDYEVFTLYLLMGGERSVRAAVKRWHEQTGQTSPGVAAFSRIATTWRWAERAEWYWRKERRRAEQLLQQRRDAIYQRFAVLGERWLEAYEKGFSRIKLDKTAKPAIEGALRAMELVRLAIGDSDEDRKRRGRPADEDGSLPALEDRLKPPDEETPNPVRPGEAG